MNPPTNQPADGASLIKPMAVWLIVQLGALAIGCFGVPLAAKRIHPPEALSIYVMAVAQAGAAALLWPMLMRSWRTSLAILLTAQPFYQACSFLSATPRSASLFANGIIFVWLITLAVLPRCSKTTTFMYLMRAIVITWCLGGAVLAYLAAEFSSPINATLAGPIAQILSALQGETVARALLLDSILLAITVFSCVVMLRKSSKQNPSV